MFVLLKENHGRTNCFLLTIDLDRSVSANQSDLVKKEKLLLCKQELAYV